ncbi:Hypothetical predicted protein [Mytilus galloprovincialis]|uniref:Uncharacterized protein n=1 Tax=Mytilus galloprovincialis TaxID=29158 RepID=A0A8B6CVX9_MYTGA|nr:Hypothetical predicted protein [Mytilus galloprovincialis]
MFIKVVILLCVVVGVLSKVIPITNICESQEGILRCSYSGEGQYLSLQQLDNYREIHFTRFFHPSTLFVDNAKHLKRIIIHSGSVRCEDITTNNPEVLVTIAGIPCKCSTAEAVVEADCSITGVTPADFVDEQVVEEVVQVGEVYYESLIIGK